MASQHSIGEIANNIKVLVAFHEFVRFSDKKTAAIRSRRFHLNTRSAVWNLQHLSHNDSDPNQTEPE
jgi:hypothetical protein